MLGIFAGDVEQAGERGTVRVRLAGQVRGQWVEELRRLCAGLLASGCNLEIEMTDVSFVDQHGCRLLRELEGDRVSLVNCALFVSEQLRAGEQDV
jgi:hypothetical protein